VKESGVAGSVLVVGRRDLVRERVKGAFDRDQIVALGLHTVFEHHDVGGDALAVFLSEYRIDLPVGIDRHDGDPVPPTMQHYGLRVTPSTVLIDRGGRLRHSAFGTVDDLVLGAQLGQLLAEALITPQSVVRTGLATPVNQLSAAPAPTSHP
jgi:hypothetical protein